MICFAYPVGLCLGSGSLLSLLVYSGRYYSPRMEQAEPAAAGTDATKDEALSYRASLLPSSLAFWYTCS